MRSRGIQPALLPRPSPYPQSLPFVRSMVRVRDCNFMAVMEDSFGGSVVGIEIRLLGRFSVRLDGDEIPPGAFGGRLARALVRVLLTRRGRFVSRDLLTESLWLDSPPANPDMNLNVLVNR